MGYQEEIASGREAFGHLIKVWHERNGWSHRILPGLATVLDFGRIHNSQVSMLRNRKLAAPGPEVFLALGRINQWLADPDPTRLASLAAQPELAAALQAGDLPLLGNDGIPLGPGPLLEIFVGMRPPPAAFDLRIGEAEAASLSSALAELLSAGRTWRGCREQILAAYPVEKAQRRERFAAVMAGQRDYSSSELDGELLDLHRTVVALGVASEPELSADQFLEALRRKARLQQQTGNLELAAAIRQELAAAETAGS
ncbi:hypothetical protein KQ313_01840 [Synechococcus sp. CS-1325]|uniref:hypothetical protein n=1 Tax=unclassified Synechococcus TaxID=2626047 RepID=UPI000DAF9A0B|nr:MULTISPECIES: hypothetical protein [unclassified Synechococcus]MCT0198429.1 hypothetical protein [Synechococcus sp. CS-1325]MCT0213549.1 hypothetical protein [Synechococcus sp. CS-1326]MCT0232140.1 hypothetical protein [Synechococcus sp. CS-1327]PZU99181.1 MAG: hypothetical protein DCF24_09475 [Cyanobium sp.]